MIQEKKAIVLGADNSYLNQLTTTIKSICAHNHHLKFYIFNDDLPQEWFQIMNRNLQSLQSEILNIKVNSDMIKNYRLPTIHLKYATYFRYFIGDIVTEERALYLDSDMIIQSDLEELFQMDLKGLPLAAVPDFPVSSEKFNAGLLVIDVPLWREERISQQLLDLTAEKHEQVYGDQEILNILFENRWLALDWSYNLQVGADSHYFYLENSSSWYDGIPYEPKIIHYTTERKPWLATRFNRYRDRWWFYYQLSWEDCLLRKFKPLLSFSELVGLPQKHAVIFTNTGDIAHIEYLVAHLPELQFHIAAPTFFSPNIVELEKYVNVSVYPCVDPFDKKKLIDKCDIYLDINYGPEMGEPLRKIEDKEVPIFTFEDINHSHQAQQIFSQERPEDMVVALQSYLKGES